MLFSFPPGLKARLQVAGGWKYFAERLPFCPARFSRRLLLVAATLFLLSPTLLRALETEILFADYDDQGFFNSLAGDSGVFASGPATITMSFTTNTCFGKSGASLRIDYDVPSGYCGVWNSLLGRASYSKYT